jgi:hypothetical protein
MLVRSVLAVLALGAVGFLLRGALPSSGATPPAPEGPVAVREPAPGGFSPAAAQSRRVPRGSSLIVAARGRSLRAYRMPRAGARSRRVRARVIEGQRVPLRFMVLDKKRGWVRVQLPDASRRWVRRSDVALQHTPYKLVVQRRQHRLVLLRFGRVARRFRIAAGKELTPTPAGRYYVTDLIRSKDPFYGPYVLGLSAGSSEQLGIHGTSDPSSIGRDVSRGCIRVHNGVVKRLARIVPIGTPVIIR